MESIHQKKLLSKSSVLMIMITLPAKRVVLRDMQPFEQAASACIVLLFNISAAFSLLTQRKYMKVKERKDMTSPGIAVSGY